MSEAEEMKQHAWFSQRMVERCGTNFYEHENGEIVEVTAVASDESFPDTCGPDLKGDLKYLGRVKRWVRRGLPRMKGMRDGGV